MLKKELKQVVIGEVPEDLYSSIMSGAANVFRAQFKIQKREGQSDEDFVKQFLLQSIISAYKQNEADIRKSEIDKLLKQ